MRAPMTYERIATSRGVWTILAIARCRTAWISCWCAPAGAVGECARLDQRYDDILTERKTVHEVAARTAW